MCSAAVGLSVAVAAAAAEAPGKPRESPVLCRRRASSRLIIRRSLIAEREGWKLKVGRDFVFRRLGDLCVSQSFEPVVQVRVSGLTCGAIKGKVCGHLVEEARGNKTYGLWFHRIFEIIPLIKCLAEINLISIISFLIRVVCTFRCIMFWLLIDYLMNFMNYCDYWYDLYFVNINLILKRKRLIWVLATILKLM